MGLIPCKNQSCQVEAAMAAWTSWNYRCPICGAELQIEKMNFSD